MSYRKEAVEARLKGRLITMDIALQNTEDNSEQNFIMRGMSMVQSTLNAILRKKCIRCGSPLTSKKSKERGYGPHCWSIVRRGVDV